MKKDTNLKFVTDGGQKERERTSNEPKPRCSRMIPGEGTWGAFHMRHCSRPVKTERDGKAYCSIHDPEVEEKRRIAKHERWDAEAKARRKRELPRLYAEEMLALLLESQTSIGGDWRERRDALIAKLDDAVNG